VTFADICKGRVSIACARTVVYLLLPQHDPLILVPQSTTLTAAAGGICRSMALPEIRVRLGREAPV